MIYIWIATASVLILFALAVAHRMATTRQYSEAIEKDDVEKFSKLRETYSFFRTDQANFEIVLRCCWKASQHRKLLSYLCDSGMDFKMADSLGQTPLHWLLAVDGPRREDLVAMFVRAGAEVNRANNDGWTPLHVAAKFGLVQTVKLFLSHGADPEFTNKDGDSAKDLASKFEQKEVLEAFAEHGRQAGR